MFLLSASVILTFFELSSSLCTIFAAAEYAPCTEDCVYEASADQLADINLRLFDGDITRYVDKKVINALDLLDELTISKPTILYIHGWIEFIDPGGANAVIRAYLNGGNHNVILVDWLTLSTSGYAFAVKSVQGIAYYLAKSLNDLVAGGLNGTDINIIGHSVGAQIAGFTGRYANFTVAKITGLDPAGPFFDEASQRLTNEDADFVQIIHTDRGVLGIDWEIGDVEFYPNNGKNIQPGCLTALNICSHYRAVFIYAESVTNPTSFIAKKCDSNENFERGLCTSNQEIPLGYATPTNARGRFYLQTNKESPYGRGEDGTIYKPTSTIESMLSFFLG